MYVASVLGLTLAIALLFSPQSQAYELIKNPSKGLVFCQTSAFNLWTYNFLQFIGFPGSYTISNASSIWATYYPLAYFLNNAISVNPGSVDGFYTICNGFEQLWGGLLDNGNQNCLTAENLINGQSVDPVTAFAVVGMLKKYKFICGAGFYTLLHENLSCIQRVIAHFNTTFQMCLTTWQTNVQHDPTNACTYMSDFIFCNAQIFNASSCSTGNNMDYWWGCEGALQFALAQYPSCGHARSCTLNRPPFGSGGFEVELMEYMRTHHKVENGQHWFKFPAIFKKINGQWVLSENDWVTG